MKVYKAIYSLKEKSKKINILDTAFANKYKYRYKIIYSNKLFPLQSKFKIYDNKKKKIKD